MEISGFDKKFLSFVSGPSASTARHLENISQYPWVFAHAEPGLSIKPVAFFKGLINIGIS